MIGYSEKARMKALRQFGIVILLLVSYLAPVMACILPGAQMTAQERACCRMVHGQCEQMGMPASHSCCQKAQRSSLDKALVTKATNYQLVSLAAGWLVACKWLPTSLVTAERITRPDDSPPQVPLGTTAVLRI